VITFFRRGEVAAKRRVRGLPFRDRASRFCTAITDLTDLSMAAVIAGGAP
jgi:hypothetical protein